MWCGSAGRFEIDHIDKTTRVYRFPHFFKTRDEIFYAELAKCQILCRDCHMKKSIAERGRRYGKGVYGTVTYHDHHDCRCDKCRKANSMHKAQRRALGKI